MIVKIKIKMTMIASKSKIHNKFKDVWAKVIITRNPLKKVKNELFLFYLFYSFILIFIYFNKDFKIKFIDWFYILFK
jgi:hypothetical protein